MERCDQCMCAHEYVVKVKKGIVEFENCYYFCNLTGDRVGCNDRCDSYKKGKPVRDKCSEEYIKELIDFRGRKEVSEVTKEEKEEKQEEKKEENKGSGVTIVGKIEKVEIGPKGTRMDIRGFEVFKVFDLAKMMGKEVVVGVKMRQVGMFE